MEASSTTVTVAEALAMGLAELRAGRLAEAEALYRQIIAADAAIAEAWHMLGIIASQAGNLPAAVRLLRQAAALDPADGAVLGNLGALLREQGELAEGERCLRQALVMKPDYAEAWNNLGLLLEGRNFLKEAENCFGQALRFAPGLAAAHYNLGNIARSFRRLDDAGRCYSRALAIDPNLPQAWNNLGNVYKEQRRLDLALHCYQKSLALMPQNADAGNNLGQLAEELGNLDQALAAYQSALAANPDFLRAKANLLHQLQHICDWGNLDADVRVVRACVQSEPESQAGNIPPFNYLALPGSTAAEQLRCSQAWGRSFAPLVAQRGSLERRFERRQKDRLRIGYLSADLHDHATARLMAEVFERHDRTRFDVVAYSYGMDDESPMRARLVRAFDRFVDLSELSDEAAAERIYEDGVDILLDLKGYTQYARNGILALRPAPIQVNYLGYPGTMGVDFVDYLLADRFIVPPEHFPYYMEKVVWLADCYQPTDRSRVRHQAPTRAACGLPESGVVFCCFNQTYKITPTMFDIWCRLLREVDGSVLWLLESNPLVAANLRTEAVKRGVAGERLVMAGKIGPEAHLARIQNADIFLDTLPYNAHTTCSDALWMGVPVVTCAGDTFPARVAGSLLTAFGLPELITANLDDYFVLARELATDSEKLRAIRDKIAVLRETAPLFDSARFTRNLESAFETMWQAFLSDQGTA